MKPFSSRWLAFIGGAVIAMYAFGALAQDARPATPAEPSVAQIYQAANSGDLARADAMIQQVLKAHPNSAKAHYVKAELSAREGKLDVAREQLATAEKLAPGLPFAKAESVQALRNQLSNAAAKRTPAPATRQMGAPSSQAPVDAAPAPQPQRSFPWGMLALVAGIVVIGAMILRRRTAAPAGAGYGGTYGNPPAAPYGQAGTGPMYPPGAGVPQQPSMGGSLARGLGTGLAVGAGVLAAEEIGRRVFGHGDARAAGYDAGNANTPSLDQIDEGMRRNLNTDMGGNDFGVADGGSWDDGGGSFDGGGGGGGGDWDS